MHFLLFFCLTLTVTRVDGHGSMINPRPRSAHNQNFDDRNKCGCQNTPGGCYSNASSPGNYCGLGCIGESCLYYQIGCFQNCPQCSYTGKTLYPVPEDLKNAGNCPTPPAPTLGGGDKTKEHDLRTYNIDGESPLGDWTRWNPWRSPGTAGKGNSMFQPCGVNSGSSPDFPDPPAGGQPQFANGTDLPPVGPATVWQANSVVEAEWSIYANHGGGYSFRLCQKIPGQAETEACYQKTPLDFADDFTTVKYYDGSRSPFSINATTTNVGTFPTGSQWRKNPIPMCNCDIGTACAKKGNSNSKTKKMAAADKKCKAVPKELCGTTVGKNTCLSCGTGSSYDCEVCCPGLSKHTQDGYSWCSANATGCSKENPQGCYRLPYETTYLKPGQNTPECPTGLMFPSSWDEGYGQGEEGAFMFSMIDRLQVPDLPAGDYSLSWRWDCEQTPQVWNSCADIKIQV